VLAFELNDILVRHKYVKASYAFHPIYGLCITFILALFQEQTFCYRFSRQVSTAPTPFKSIKHIIFSSCCIFRNDRLVFQVDFTQKCFGSYVFISSQMQLVNANSLGQEWDWNPWTVAQFYFG